MINRCHRAPQRGPWSTVNDNELVVDFLDFFLFYGFFFSPFEDKIGWGTRHLVDGLPTNRTRGIHPEIGGDAGLGN